MHLKFTYLRCIHLRFIYLGFAYQRFTYLRFTYLKFTYLGFTYLRFTYLRFIYLKLIYLRFTYLKSLIGVVQLRRIPLLHCLYITIIRFFKGIGIIQVTMNYNASSQYKTGILFSETPPLALILMSCF